MENKDTIKDWISHFAFFKKLTELSFVKKIVLYGSRARNDNQERSDIDLAITCPEATLYDWVTIREIIDDADTLLHIDCIRFDSLNESDFKNNILKDSIMLYEKKGL